MKNQKMLIEKKLNQFPEKIPEIKSLNKSPKDLNLKKIKKTEKITKTMMMRIFQEDITLPIMPT